MKLLVNTTNLITGGALQVAHSLLAQWTKNATGLEMTCAVSPQVARILPETFSAVVVPHKPSHPINGFKARQILSNMEDRVRPDAVLSIFTPAYWRPRSPHVCGFAWPWIDRANPWPWKNLAFPHRIRQCLKIVYKLRAIKNDQAAAFIVETAAMADCLKRFFPRTPMHVVSNNCGQPFCTTSTDQSHMMRGLLPPKASDEFRIVTLTQYYPHKHLEILPLLCRQLKTLKPRRRFRFYLPLPPDGPHWQSLQKTARSFGVADYLYTTGPIRPSLAPAFYEEADLMFLPTLLESFSANYPEAMHSRVPILTTDIAFAHSICQDAALYYRPMDAVDAADKLIQIESDPDLARQLVVHGAQLAQVFPSPAEKAAAYLKICRQTIEVARQ